MQDILAVIAAGKSSRFGGFPKAFCKLHNGSNIENTIRLAKRFYHKIYVVDNQETHQAGIDQDLDAIVIPIVTGQGDADSVLKALKVIHSLEADAGCITFCWGDAVFLDETPFREMERYVSAWEGTAPILVGCCQDKEPYAWFDVDGDKIIRSHFRKEDGVCPEGMHDQSIFAVRVIAFMQMLTSYKHHLGLDTYPEDSYEAARGEMRLLDAFTYFARMKEQKTAEIRKLTSDKVRSFNTREELLQIMWQS